MLTEPRPADTHDRELTEVWEDAPGFVGFFTTVDHKRIGVRYIYTSFFFFFIGKPRDGGWFAYVPLTGRTYIPGLNMDFWGLAVIFVGLSTTVGSVNFIVTIFKMRAPGMTLNRMPIFVWSMLVFSFMAIFAVPAVTLSSALIELDRLFGTAF